MFYKAKIMYTAMIIMRYERQNMKYEIWNNTGLNTYVSVPSNVLHLLKFHLQNQEI